MSEGFEFEIPLEEDRVVFGFKKRDWRLIQYLVSTHYRHGGKELLLSILMYPAVWSVESLIWQRVYETSLSIDDGSDIKDRFDSVSKAKDECYEKARIIVKNEMNRQAKTIRWRELVDDIKIKKHEFSLRNDLGCAVFSTVLSKTDWNALIEICLQRRLNDAGRFLINYLTMSICFGVADAIWDRDYQRQLVANSNGDDAELIIGQLKEELNLRTDLIKTSKQRIFHCMK